MGHKSNPIGLRLKINRTWDSRWFCKKKYGDLLIEDIKIRAFLNKKLPQAGVSTIIIERPAKKAIISIRTARPGVIIGKKGADIEQLKIAIQKMTSADVSLNIIEVRKPELDAKLVADNISRQIASRGSYRRAMKRAIQSTMKLGAEGIKVTVSGRLNGAEIARPEQYSEGRIPLHTLRADIDYGVSEALTTYGIIGVKVRIYRGDILGCDPLAVEQRTNANTANVS